MGYFWIFQRNEFRDIRGRRGFNLWVLGFVFLLSLGALSYSRSGLAYLKAKMEDPFINWVNISNEPQLSEYSRMLNQGMYDGKETIKDHFHIDTVEQNNFLVQFVEGKRFIGRTINHSSSLWDKILHPENIRYRVLRSEPISATDFGWVVTADALHALGYDESNIPLFISFEYKTLYSTSKVPVPLLAVVDRLPDDIDFVTTNYFYEQYWGNASGQRPFALSDSSLYFGVVQFVSTDESDFQVLKECLSGLDLEWERPDLFMMSFQEANLYSAIVRDTVLSMAELDSICQSVCTVNPGIYRWYDYDFGQGTMLKPDYVSIMFSDLEKIKEFQEWSKQSSFGIGIDMAQIEAKENFNHFNKLALGLGLCIMLMSLFFVSIFIYALMNNHFQKISRNLGTIIAFGLESRTLISIYLVVFLKLVVCSLLPSWCVIYILQLIFDSLSWGYNLSGVVIPYLNAFDVWVVMTIVGLLVVSAIVTYYFLRQKLNSTPGDLIYERNL